MSAAIRQAHVSAFATLLLIVGVLPLAAADYFVRSSGNDDAQGVSQSAAWRTIERVNHARFQPGDRILFEAGASFSGNLCLTAASAGTSSNPVVIGSFGEGRATIRAGKGTGISVENAGGVTIQDLIVIGDGRTNNNGYGVCCDNTLADGSRLGFLRVANVEAQGFGMLGILVSGTHAGFEHLVITNCVMHANLRGGMEIAGRLPWDSTVYAHSDVLITHCRAYDNTGDPTYLKNHSGSGIVLYQVDGGVMEDCAAWNNGVLCRSSGGAVGLWVCASRRVVIQRCESFANRTSGGDGGGFDIDGGCQDCVLQYNYSHDNDGPGLMVYSYPYVGFADRGAIVRFNISENDSRKGSRYAGLWVRTDGKEITGLQIYNNTVIIGPWTGQAALINAAGIEACVRNNIFIAADAAVPLRVESPESQVRFENNLYWREGGPTEISWGSQTFTNLRDWREHTGQELISGSPTGLFADPVLSRNLPASPASGLGGLQAVRAFRPLPRSPAIAGGLDLRKMFGLDVGTQDIIGTLPLSGPFPLGAIGAPAIE